MQEPDAAGHDSVHGAGTQGRARCGVRHASQNQTKWLKEVAPAPGDIKITNTAQDRFYDTDLDKELKAKGIRRSSWSAGRSAVR